MLVLRTLRRGEQHGYGISQAIAAGTGDVLHVETGSLYPALHRLEKRRLIKANWKTTDNNQRAKYYCLTPAGSRHLAREESRWSELVRAIAAMSRPGRQEGS
jgi:PadR family transcriptional regulator, regulatory protein PadR